MDFETTRANYEKAVRELIVDYLQAEKNAGKNIEEVNPWQILEENRLRLAKEVTEGTNYPATVQGETVALLIIESELNKTYGDDYLAYVKKNPHEPKIDIILEKEADRVAKDKVGSPPSKSVDKDAVKKVWLTMISQYMPYLALKLHRDVDGKSKVVERKVDELEQYIEEAIKKLQGNER